MKAGTVIVTYNSAGHIGPCLDALRNHAPEWQVLVVDNNSRDATLAEVAARVGVRVIPNPANRGFAGAVNQGFRALPECDAVLVLNPDTRLECSPQPLLGELDDADVGACGGKLLGEDGLAQRGFQVRRFPPASALVFESLGVNRLWKNNPVNRRYRCLDMPQDVEQDVEQPAGAMLMVRRAAWASVDGFDEEFHPVWFEDVDFLVRLKLKGWRVRYTPKALARHAGGHSVGLLAWRDRQLHWYGSLLKYAVKHYSAAGRVMVSGAVASAVLLKAASQAVRSMSCRHLPVCGKLLRLSAVACLTGRRSGPGGSGLWPAPPAGVDGSMKYSNSGDRSPH